LEAKAPLQYFKNADVLKSSYDRGYWPPTPQAEFCIRKETGISGPWISCNNLDFPAHIAGNPTAPSLGCLSHNPAYLPKAALAAAGSKGPREIYPCS
jgi:hypothetical protein